MNFWLTTFIHTEPHTIKNWFSCCGVCWFWERFNRKIFQCFIHKRSPECRNNKSWHLLHLFVIVVTCPRASDKVWNKPDNPYVFFVVCGTCFCGNISPFKIKW